MTTKEKFEALPVELVSDFLKRGAPNGIPESVQSFILAMDKVPTQIRRTPNISKCCRELMRLYPDLYPEFKTTQNIVYAAIEYFNLNNGICNAAWDNFYADKQEELAQIAALGNNFVAASLCIDRARSYRTSRNENAVDVSKIKPHTFVVSPIVTPRLLGLPEDASLADIFKEKANVYKNVKGFVKNLDIRDTQKEAVLSEASKVLNQDFTDYEDCDE